MQDSNEARRSGREPDGVPPVGGAGWMKIVVGVLAGYLPGPSWLVARLHKLRGVKVQNPDSLFIAGGVLIDSRFPELVTIEDHVYLTRGAVILTHFSPTPPQIPIAGGIRTGPVRIKRGAHIGVNAIILPGVVVGECAIVGAGAVVTRDVPDHTFVAGNPARPIKPVEEIGREGRAFSPDPRANDLPASAGESPPR
jgi:acetyltransferase-like isoleucine patch superfamily enzyme